MPNNAQKAIAPKVATPAEPVSRTANCEDEPIRIPGNIQRHGFLLLLDESDQTIVGASQNVEDFLEVPLALILGASLDTVLEREVLLAFKALTHSSENTGLQTYLGSFPMRGKFYSVVTHRVAGERIIEFESLDRLVSPDMASQVFTNFVSKLNNLDDQLELCQALAHQVKILTGFNRILLYRFDEFGHGTVLCEENDGVLPSYFDLRFPASDIPKQARELYILNTVRIIPDARYVPSPLHAIGNRPIATLDLSMSILRAVSPVHLEYMRNMGTLSSMSISLVCDGKLWGLLSGHHAQPRMVPYVVRSACDLLTKLVCTQLVSLRTSANLKRLVHFHDVQRRMLTQMAAENNYLAAMADQMETLIEITAAEGAALVTEGHLKVFGQTPGDTQIKRIAAWLDTMPDLEIFESGHLSSHIEWAEEFKAVASGMLAIRTSSVRQSYLMWFRPEVVTTVKWAGEPIKADDKGLNPRESFDAWRELVLGRSLPWAEMEIESATDFRNAIMTISLKRAEEAVQLSEARFLQLTNSLPHPVWTATDDGEITYVNQKWLDEGLNDRGCWFAQDRIAEEDRDACKRAWEAAVAEGVPFDVELRLKPPSDGPVRWNLVRGIPYVRAGGSRAGWIGTCTDLTDRRQHEVALRMTEKLALTGRMTSVIAHEINNPLESLTNLLYLLRSRVQEDEESRSYISLAESELHRISGITKQTLRWSKENLQEAEYGVAGDLFHDVLRLFAGRIRNQEIKVSVGPGEDIRFFGAIGQIKQVMANLIANAMQAATLGGRLWLSAERHGSHMDIIVRDEGHGMSEETLRNLFQPFFSTKGDLGNGLGLYISHEIVERHGGTLTVKSKLGEGTEVRVRLPASAPPSAGN